MRGWYEEREFVHTSMTIMPFIEAYSSYKVGYLCMIGWTHFIYTYIFNKKWEEKENVILIHLKLHTVHRVTSSSSLLCTLAQAPPELLVCWTTHSLNLLVHLSVLGLLHGEYLVNISRNIKRNSNLMGRKAVIRAIKTSARIALFVACLHMNHTVM